MSQRHHRRSIRLPGYDYTQPGAYCITICSHDRREIFGEILAGEMQLNTCGHIAWREWERLPSRFPSLQLGAFVIMPNHMHGILIISDDCTGRSTAAFEEGSAPSSIRRAPTTDTTRCAPTTDTNRRAPTPTGEQFGRPVAGSIPTILRSYKSAVTLRVNRLRVGARRQAKRDQILPQSAVPLLDHPVWQRNYHEHVIRNDDEQQRIHDYIFENPQRWEEDAENPVRRLK